jgi:hypothetical protein
LFTIALLPHLNDIHYRIAPCFECDFGGALFESNSQDGCTALIWASANGHADCARLLIDAGADKEAMTNVRVGRCFTGAPFHVVSSFMTFYLIFQHLSLRNILHLPCCIWCS